MEYWSKCPDPDDKEGWRQWTKCHAIAAVVGIIIFAVVIFFLR